LVAPACPDSPFTIPRRAGFFSSPVPPPPLCEPADRSSGFLLQRPGLHLPKNLPLAGQFLKKM